MTSQLPPPAANDFSPALAPAKTELWLIGILCLAGLTLRCAWPERLAVEHFDEGIYASNLWFGEKDNFQFPKQSLYAPPLLPRLIEWTLILFGPSNGAAVAVSILAGSLTVPLVWWVGRRWFGPVAGLSAAALAAFSDPHLFYSRAALTDVLLCFWLLLAVYFVCEGLATGRALPVVAAGSVTGLAWWTKYNGWLPLAIGLAGLIPFELIHRNAAPSLQKPARRKLMIRWLSMAVLAFLAWLPFLAELQTQGGYAAVARNHRGYLVGWGGWYESLVRQIAHQRELNGSLSLIGLGLAGAFAAGWPALTRLCFTWNGVGDRKSPAYRKAAVLIAIGIAAVAAPGVVVGLVAGAGIGIGLWTTSRQGKEDTGQIGGRPAGIERLLAAWLLAAWFVGLSVSIPFYTPFPRLALPWLVACWLGTGCAAEWFATSISQPATRRPVVWVWGCTAAIAAGVIALGFSRPFKTPDVPGWEARTALADLAPEIVDVAFHDAGVARTTELDQLAIYVYGEPALLFQLRLAGLEHVVPVMHLAFARPEAPAPRLPTFVVTGPHAQRTSAFPTQFEEGRQRLRLVRTFDYTPSRLVLLDSPAPPPGRGAPRQPAIHHLELYRVE